MMKSQVQSHRVVGWATVQRFLFDVRTQVWVLVAAMAVGTTANVGAQVLTGRHYAALDARSAAIGQIEEAARRAEIEAVIKAFEGGQDGAPLEARLHEVESDLSALRDGDSKRGIPVASGPAVPAIEQARLVWAQERARLLQAAVSAPALRVALDDGTSRQFMRSMRDVDVRFETAGSSTVRLLNLATLVTDAFAIVIALAAMTALLRRVSDSRHRLDRLSKEIEEGNIWPRYGARYPHGMVGTLARSFDRMVESLGNKAQLERDALTDALTGLPNRRAFFIELEEIVREAAPSGGTFDVCFVDVDELKSINDQFGHAEGDIALQDVAHALRQRFGDSSVIGRLGGDEFAVIYAGAERLSTDVVSSEIALLLAEVADTEARVCAVEVSVGVTPYSRADTADLLVQRADRSMYSEKRARAEARTRRRLSA